MSFARSKAAVRFTWLLVWLLVAADIPRAEQLPIKTYTTADGLARDSINRIVRDSRGFLWFCTAEGLSRFDGYQFTNYTTDQGLPHRWVSDLLEARDGTYWVATGNGVCAFNPAGAPLFTVYRPGENEAATRVEALAEDKAGVLWCGTRNGVYALEETEGARRFVAVDMGMLDVAEANFVQTVMADREGALWFGTRGGGLYRRWPDGRVEHYETQNGLPHHRVECLLEDTSGRLWVGTVSGLCELVPAPDPNRNVVARIYTTADGLVSNWINSLFESDDGRFWIGTNGGLSEFLLPAELARNSGRQFRTYTSAQGLSGSDVIALAEDRDDNLWLGTDGGGAMKLVRSGFTTYNEADGVAAAGVAAIFEDRAGELCVVSSDTRHIINRFDGRRFSEIAPAFPKHINKFGWGWNQITVQDSAGEWWVPTGQGLCRFPVVSHVEQLANKLPKAIYTTREGLPFNDVFRLYEDARGDLWISTLSVVDNGLSRWERATETLRSYSDADGLIALRTHPIVSFAEDAVGNLWMGRWGGGLTCYAAGRFRSFTEADGLPAGTIRAVFVDSAHRLWIASAFGGVARVDNPASGNTRFVSYTTADGLSSNDCWCITEDRWGRIYVGTGRGLDQLDVQNGHIKHFTAADGLVRGNVATAFRDRHGNLWFGSNNRGLSRLVPRLDSPHAPPPIVISGLRISGVTYPISQLGETEISRLDLGPSQNQLNIDFVGLSFGPGEVLQYQYRLEGADQDWGAPGNERSVNYASLAPGRYRFMVRAINDEGLTSSPATIAFTIPRPVWRRWWFLMLMALVVGLTAYFAHRQRVARLVELERIRTRIATYLHDDIGANLSLIAMLSDVARAHLQRDDQRMKEWFSTIATTSRDTVDAMSDIVWAVNPKRDQLRDLTHRMRRFSEDIFGARDIELHFRAEPERDFKVGADLRREVFLIFKESINNIVRHSKCTTASIEVTIEHGWFVLLMTDNGRGINGAGAVEGNGLASMRQRAARLGGRLEVVSANGNGTTVTLRVPLEHRARFSIAGDR